MSTEPSFHPKDLEIQLNTAARDFGNAVDQLQAITSERIYDKRRVFVVKPHYDYLGGARFSLDHNAELTNEISLAVTEMRKASEIAGRMRNAFQVRVNTLANQLLFEIQRVIVRTKPQLPP